jgi:hypothetical protein
MSASRPFSSQFADSFGPLPAPPVDVAGWPAIEDLEQFTRQGKDDIMQWALGASIAYGQKVLDESDQIVNEPSNSVFMACLDYAAALYTARNGGVDLTVDLTEGSTPLQRYRKILLADRAVGFA